MFYDAQTSLVRFISEINDDDNDDDFTTSGTNGV